MKSKRKQAKALPLALPPGVELGQAAQVVPSLWAYLNRVLRKKPLSYTHTSDPYRHRPFLELFLNDPHPQKVLMKARQLGASEAGVTEALFLVNNYAGITCIYTMPRWQQANEFSSLRLDEAIVQSPGIRARCAGASSSAKTFVVDEAQAKSIILIKSSWEESLGEGTPADCLILDEYDRMKKGAEDAFKESLSSSRLRWMRFYSTPTLPGWGIAKKYEETDKRRWHLRCRACNEWQVPRWPDTIHQTKGPEGLIEKLRFDPGLDLEPGTFVRVCLKCGAELNLMECAGEWVAELSARSATEPHGYAVSQLAAPWVTADQLVLKMREHQLIQHFHNYVLGEPFVGEGGMATEADVMKVVNPSVRPSPGFRVPGWTKVGVGIDWGDINWISVVAIPEATGKPTLVDVMRLPAKGQSMEACNAVLEAIEPYLPETIVADQGYGQDRNPYMASKLGHRFWSCLYPGGTRATSKAEWSPLRHEVLVGRTPGLKSLFERLHAGYLHIAPLPETKLQWVVKHFTALVPWKETRQLDGQIFEEIVRTGDDHLAHATLYALLALERSTMAQAKLALVDIGSGSSPVGNTPPALRPPTGDETSVSPAAAGMQGWKMDERGWYYPA